MDEFIAKCVRMADIFAKINDRVVLWKLLTDEEYQLFCEMYNVYSAFKYSQNEAKEIKENV